MVEVSTHSRPSPPQFLTHGLVSDTYRPKFGLLSSFVLSSRNYQQNDLNKDSHLNLYGNVAYFAGYYGRI
jgi:hypothetical protein